MVAKKSAKRASAKRASAKNAPAKKAPARTATASAAPLVDDVGAGGETHQTVARSGVTLTTQQVVATSHRQIRHRPTRSRHQ